MGIFDDFTLNDKKRTLDAELNGHQMMLYAILVQIGIDPDTFDADTWDEPVNMDFPRGRVAHYVELINLFKAKKLALEENE